MSVYPLYYSTRFKFILKVCNYSSTSLLLLSSSCLESLLPTKCPKYVFLSGDQRWTHGIAGAVWTGDGTRAAEASCGAAGSGAHHVPQGISWPTDEAAAGEHQSGHHHDAGPGSWRKLPQGPGGGDGAVIHLFLGCWMKENDSFQIPNATVIDLLHYFQIMQVRKKCALKDLLCSLNCSLWIVLPLRSKTNLHSPFFGLSWEGAMKVMQS